MSSEIYYRKGDYFPHFHTIYAQYLHVNCPQPRCRKYHISSDIDSAQAIAGIVLPYLKMRGIFHKVVQHETFLIQQTTGMHRAQRGKFITVYMPATVQVHNGVMTGLFVELVRAAEPMKPGPRPLRRLSAHGPDDTLLFEDAVYSAPLEKTFIYGGFECDSSE